MDRPRHGVAPEPAREAGVGDRLYGHQDPSVRVRHVCLEGGAAKSRITHKGGRMMDVYYESRDEPALLGSSYIREKRSGNFTGGVPGFLGKASGYDRISSVLGVVQLLAYFFKCHSYPIIIPISFYIHRPFPSTSSTLKTCNS